MQCLTCQSTFGPNEVYCPKCGNPLSKPVGSLRKTLVVVTIVAAFWGFALLSVWHKQPAVSDNRNAVPQTSATPDIMSKADHLKRARSLLEGKHPREALDDIATILPADPEFVAGQKLYKEALRQEAVLHKTEEARREPQRISEREQYANTLERHMLESYNDMYVRLSGPNKTTITFQYVLMGMPLVYNLTNDSDFMGKLRNLGFKKAIFTDGYDSTWNYSL